MNTFLIIMSESYPSAENLYAMNYVHTRVCYYQKNGIECTVLSFSAKSSYEFEDITVLNEKDALEKIKEKGKILIISHAPNLKNHIRFLNKLKKKNIKVIFFFHGHEILDFRKYYPKPFWFDYKGKLLRFIHIFYDFFKLKILKRLMIGLLKKDKLEIVFVSTWMKNAARESLKIRKQQEILENHSHIINNSIHEIFNKLSYSPGNGYIADFVTIRPFDNPKYGVDILVKIAQNNPQFNFHLYGKGKYFNYIAISENLTIFNKFLLQKDIPSILNKYRAAIMPTRLDAQGVMMCEIATYGIPLFGSDLPICREMIGHFNNVRLFNNDSRWKLEVTDEMLKIDKKDKNKFAYSNTIKKEIELINNIQ